MLAPIGGPVSDAQDQASWYVNDNPSLFGPSQYWWAGDAGKGYGSNNYVYTYGIAGESSADNWARWSMGRRVGRQEIQVYVPNTRATATVLYRIDIGGSRYTKRVVQRNAYGWTALGTYDVDGASVTITLRDNDASQHWNRDGYGSSSIGVDAAAMRCVSRCSSAPTVTVTPVPENDVPSRPRNLRASPDEDTVLVSWSPPSDDGGAAVSGYRVDLYRGGSRVDRKSLSASSRSATFEDLGFDTAYRVRVSARNSEGYGSSASVDFRTEARAQQQQVVRSVALSLGADRAGCSDQSKPCRWLSASYGGFDGGRYSALCYWSTSRSSLGTSFASFTARTAGGGDSTLCWFNGTPGRYLTAVVDGVRSNTIQFSGTAPTPDPTATSTPTVTVTPVPENGVPSRPRSVRASADADSVDVSWSAPSDDGGAGISGYRVDLYRGSSRVDRKSLSGSARSASFTGLAADTAYEVRISARNSAGRGPTATASVRTDSVPQRQESVPGLPSEPRNVRAEEAGENGATVSWAPPASNGGNPLTGYQIELFRGSTFVDRKSTSASTRSTSFNNLDPDTAYTVLVSAKNSQGLSNPEVVEFRTHPATIFRALIRNSTESTPPNSGLQCMNEFDEEDRHFRPNTKSSSECVTKYQGYINDEPEVIGDKAGWGSGPDSGWKPHDPKDRPTENKNEWTFGRNGSWYTKKLDDEKQKAKWTFQGVKPGYYALMVYVPSMGSDTEIRHVPPNFRAQRITTDTRNSDANVLYRIYSNTGGNNSRRLTRYNLRIDQVRHAEWTHIDALSQDYIRCERYRSKGNYNCQHRVNSMYLEGNVNVYVGGFGIKGGAILGVDAIALVPVSEGGEPLAVWDWDWTGVIRDKIREAQYACAYDMNPGTHKALAIVLDNLIDALAGVAVGAVVGFLIGGPIAAIVGAAIGFVVGAIADTIRQTLLPWWDSQDWKEDIARQRTCHDPFVWKFYYELTREQRSR